MIDAGAPHGIVTTVVINAGVFRLTDGARLMGYLPGLRLAVRPAP